MTLEQVIQAYPVTHYTDNLIGFGLFFIAMILGIVLVGIIITSYIDQEKYGIKGVTDTDIPREEKLKTDKWNIFNATVLVTLLFIVVFGLFFLSLKYIGDTDIDARQEEWGTRVLQPYIDNNGRVVKQSIDESSTKILKNLDKEGEASVEPSIGTYIVSVEDRYITYREDDSTSKPYLEVTEYDSKLIDFLKKERLTDKYPLPRSVLIVPKGYFDEVTN